MKKLYNQYKDITFPSGRVERWKFEEYPEALYILNFCKEENKILNISEKDYEYFKKAQHSLKLNLTDGSKVEMYVFKFGNSQEKKEFRKRQKYALK